MHEALLGFNQAWAGNAAVLIVAVAETTDADGKPLGYARLRPRPGRRPPSVQAHHDGLHVHQMGGFDRDGVRAAFDLDAALRAADRDRARPDRRPVATLPEALQEREAAPRVRRPLADSLIAV